MADYSTMTNEEFDVILEELVTQDIADNGAGVLLANDEISTILREDYNNAVLDAWAERNPVRAKLPPDNLEELTEDGYSLSATDAEISAYIRVSRDEDHPERFYVSVTIDNDENHDCSDIVTDDGPYDSYTDAVQGGVNGAVDWFVANDCPYQDSDVDAIFEAANMDSRFVGVC